MAPVLRDKMLNIFFEFGTNDDFLKHRDNVIEEALLL